MILKLEAEDEDVGLNAKLTYSITNNIRLTQFNDNNSNIQSFLWENGWNDTFSIDSSKGILLVEATNLKEKEGFYSIEVQVRDGGTPSLSDTAQMNLTIEKYDENHLPQFLNPPKPGITINIFGVWTIFLIL